VSATGRGSEREELDGYFTPLLAARAIIQRLLDDRIVEKCGLVLEPSIGKGAFAVAVNEILRPTILEGVDLKLRPELDSIEVDLYEQDFLTFQPTEKGKPFRYSLVCGNPPFGDAERHIRHALTLLHPRAGVLAFILRLNFLEGKKRHATLYREIKPHLVYVLDRRPSFKKSKKVKRDKEGNVVLSKKTGKPLMVTTANDASAYGVFVWKKALLKGEYDTCLRYLSW
jgi:hypothetical protein